MPLCSQVSQQQKHQQKGAKQVSLPGLSLWLCNRDVQLVLHQLNRTLNAQSCWFGLASLENHSSAALPEFKRKDLPTQLLCSRVISSRAVFLCQEHLHYVWTVVYVKFLQEQNCCRTAATGVPTPPQNCGGWKAPPELTESNPLLKQLVQQATQMGIQLRPEYFQSISTTSLSRLFQGSVTPR